MIRIGLAAAGGYFLGVRILNAATSALNAKRPAHDSPLFLASQVATGAAIYLVLGKVL